MKPIMACWFTLALGATVAPALASDDCDAPVGHWQPREAVLQHAARQGWQVQRLKIDDGCYEVRGRDAQGRAFKAKLDPETLRVVKTKRRDGDHERDRDRERERPRDRSAEPRGANPAPAPLFTPGSAPRGQVE
ncbi:MAG: PepSY domain-containing protein [Proteobacteria bacterium]|mgnify:CR=1 FL=1|nr:PepSY domain-containing protein [Pseudomonadota bacterium]